MAGHARDGLDVGDAERPRDGTPDVVGLRDRIRGGRVQTREDRRGGRELDLTSPAAPRAVSASGALRFFRQAAASVTARTTVTRATRRVIASIRLLFARKRAKDEPLARHDVVDRLLAEPPAGGLEAHLVARDDELVPGGSVLVVEDAADRLRHPFGPPVRQGAAVEMRLHDRRLASGHLRDPGLEPLGITHRGGRVVAADAVELRPVPIEQLPVITLPAGEGDELVVGEGQRMTRERTRRLGCGTRRFSRGVCARCGVAATGRREKGDREQHASHGQDDSR